MKVTTASVVHCPNCGHPAPIICAHKKYGVKIRYRKCRKCDTRVKTIQPLDDPASKEKVIPALTEEENNKFFADLRSKYASRRASMNRVNKLNIREIAEIKYLVLNNVQTQAYTAMQYGVEKTAIHRIATGACFADVPTPRSLADL